MTRKPGDALADPSSKDGNKSKLCPMPHHAYLLADAEKAKRVRAATFSFLKQTSDLVAADGEHATPKTTSLVSCEEPRNLRLGRRSRQRNLVLTTREEAGESN